MDDPIGSHPTRAEQLDILTTMIADQAIPNDRVLDLGCGTGYVASLIFDKRRDLRYTGVDLKSESLAEAKSNLRGVKGRTDWLVGNLETVDEIEVRRPRGTPDLRNCRRNRPSDATRRSRSSTFSLNSSFAALAELQILELDDEIKVRRPREAPDPRHGRCTHGADVGWDWYGDGRRINR